MYNRNIRGPLVEGNKSLGDVTRRGYCPCGNKSRALVVLFCVCFVIGGCGLGILFNIYNFYKGIGHGGVNLSQSALGLER